MSVKPFKVAGWYDNYKSIRKPMPPPGSVMKDKRTTGPIEESEATLEDLKREAQIVCEGRGHELGPWTDIGRGRSWTSKSICEKCHKAIVVIESPAANERDMMGEAFTSACQ